ncbi:MAG TPA: hypothetical protein VGJ28_08160 [Micromonosporaceae bacterium]
MILAYKERGAYRLARPLGRQLARCVAMAARGASALVVVPVPSTAPAIRERHGDHMSRLARHCVRELRRHGVPSAMISDLTAAARGDSSHLVGRRPRRLVGGRGPARSTASPRRNVPAPV